MEELSAWSADNDPDIADSDSLFRRIAHYNSGDLVTVDKGTGQRRPSSGAFKSDSDGVSTYLNSVLRMNRLGPEDLIRAPQNAVVMLGVDIPRSRRLGVVADPWPTGTDDDAHPRNAAHSLITGLPSLGAAERRRAVTHLARSSRWVIDPGSEI